MVTLDAVRTFWENNPLWTGESLHPPGSMAFFEEHRRVVIEDCLAGEMDSRLMPPPHNRTHVLDLGCGPGLWTVEMSLTGEAVHVSAADLTENALNLARRRCELYGVKANFSRQNAEALTFEDNQFTHVNCQGVIHHTPNTEACVREIARILKPGGSALLSVYYKNLFLTLWPVLRWPGKVFHWMGAGLQGRGRESIFNNPHINEIVRLYDGSENPLGKAYSKSEWLAMLTPYFEVEAVFLHFFPARAFPFAIPLFLHRWLDKHFGFMIYAQLRKR